jgi:hypothetical protein
MRTNTGTQKENHRAYENIRERQEHQKTTTDKPWETGKRNASGCLQAQHMKTTSTTEAKELMGNQSENSRNTFGTHVNTKRKPHDTLGIPSENHRREVRGTLAKTFGASMGHIRNPSGTKGTTSENHRNTSGKSEDNHGETMRKLWKARTQI